MIKHLTVSDYALIRRQTGANQYDVGPLGFISKPDSLETDWLIVVRDFIIPSVDPGIAYCLAQPTSTSVFDIMRNSEKIGELVFSNGSNTGAISISEDTNFYMGDRIALVSPSLPDSTLENLQLVLKAKLS